MFACCFFICPSVIQEDIILAAFIRHGHTHIHRVRKKGDDCGVLALSAQGWGCQRASRAMVAPQGSLTLFFFPALYLLLPAEMRSLALSPPQRAAARVFLSIWRAGSGNAASLRCHPTATLLLVECYCAAFSSPSRSWGRLLQRRLLRKNVLWRWANALSTHRHRKEREMLFDLSPEISCSFVLSTLIIELRK